MKKYIISILLLLQGTVALAQEDKEPNLDEVYFTTKTGERITGSVTVDEKVIYMVIKSTNAIGEKVVITMDEGEDYFYKKKFLGEGSSFKFLIKEDLQKVKLIIYNPRIKKHYKRRKKAEGFDDAEDVSR